MMQINYLNRVMRKSASSHTVYVKTQLISAFIFASYIVQSPYILNPKFQASSHLLWLYSPVRVVPGLKTRRQVFLISTFGRDCFKNEWIILWLNTCIENCWCMLIIHGCGII